METLEKAQQQKMIAKHILDEAKGMMPKNEEDATKIQHLITDKFCEDHKIYIGEDGARRGSYEVRIKGDEDTMFDNLEAAINREGIDVRI